MKDAPEDNPCSAHNCPFAQVIMAQQEQIGQHAAQIAAHDKVLVGVTDALKDLSRTLLALSDSVHEHHTRDDDAAKLRLEVAAELEKRNSRRQWVLGVVLSLFIAFRDPIVSALGRAFGLN